VRFADSKWFRGRETTARRDARAASGPRDDREAELAARWRGRAWPSAKLHAHILSPLPTGTFPGVDDAEVHRFSPRTRASSPIRPDQRSAGCGEASGALSARAPCRSRAFGPLLRLIATPTRQTAPPTMASGAGTSWNTARASRITSGGTT
jgi:hypothetical protein